MSKNVANLLRCLADIVEETGEVTTEVVNEIKEESKPIEEGITKLGTDVERVLKLMSKIDENDKVKAFKQKTDNKLKKAIDEIEKLKREAVIGLMKEEKIPNSVKEKISEWTGVN
jgi:hypothetical protein